MAVTHSIDGTPVTRVRIESVALTASAELGNVAQSTIVVDDPDGTFVTVGHKDYEATEDDCASALIHKGFLGRRAIRRGPTRAGPGRQIEISIRDLNDLLTRGVIRAGGKRKREQVGTRMAWLLGSSYLSGLVADNGFVEYPTTMMDANDYRYSSRPGDVIGDCATRVNFNFFVYPDPTTGEPSLWFQDSNVSTDYSSTLRISNDIEDIDFTTTFPAAGDSEFGRDPEDVWSHVLLNYEGGRVFRSRAATESEFVRREAIAPTSSVKRRARAIAQADKYLGIHRKELDEITDRVLLPSSKVNLLREGMRVQAHYQHLAAEGYGGFFWWRVLERTVRHITSPGGIPELAGQPLYSVDLRLSPQEEACSVQPTRVQDHYAEGVEGPTLSRTWTFDTPSTPGNLIILATLSTNGTADDVVSAPPGWTWHVQNEFLNTVDDDAWRGNVFSKRSEGESSVTVPFESTGGGQPRGVLIEYAGLTNPVISGSPTYLRQHDLGYADAPSFSYPSGAALVLSFAFMPLGPGSGDHLTEGGSGALVYGLVPDPPGTGSIDCHASAAFGVGAPIGANCYGAGVGKIGAIQQLRGPADTSGTVSGWQFYYTDNGHTMTVGLVFVGDVC